MITAVKVCALLGLLAVAAAGTTEEGLAWLADKGKEDGVVTLDSGLLYKVISSGADDAPSPDEDTPCECHYRGTLTDGTEFDSSYKRGKPTEFAPNQVIKGWTEAMQLMKEGDKWELYIPSELAYGDAQRGEHITPGAVLVFELEIIKVKGKGKEEAEKKEKKKKKKKEKKEEGPEEVVTLTSANFDESIEGATDLWLVEFYAPWCGHCKNLKPEWEKAAKQLKGWEVEGVGVKLAKVDATVEKDLGTKYEISSFPTIKVFRPGAAEPEAYEGPRESAGIVSTAKELAKPVLPPLEVKQLLSATQLHKCRTNEPEDWDAEEDGPYEEEDGPANHWCVVAFLPHILDDQSAKRNERIEMLNALANADRDAPYTMLWSEAGAQYDIEQAMDLNFGFPAITAVDRDGEQYAVHSGETDKKNIEKYFLAGLKGNWGNIRKLSALPEVKTATAWDGQDGTVDEEEEFSLEDIMGED